MKSKSKKHIIGNRAARKNRVRPIILSVASALSLVPVQAAYASFAATPLGLQNKTETSGQLAVKHNIMFFIDDSGSMAFNVDGTKTTAVPPAEQRLTIAKNALNSVLDKYQDQFNWGLQTLHNNGRSDTADFSTSWSEMKNKVNQISARSGTPTTRRYYEIVSNVVMPNVQYRCQKSYVVLMSDGDANLSCNYNFQYVNPSRTRIANFSYNQGSYYSDYYNRTLNLRYDVNFADSYRYFGVSANSGACFDMTGGSYNTFWDREGGLGFFSQRLANDDFKKTGVDKAGVSWNGDPNVDPKDTDFSKQLVQTFTVGFGGGMTAVGQKYLTQGASRPEWYFNAQSSDSLLNAFTTIAKSIQNDSANIGLVGTGTVAPAKTSSGISGMAANVELDSGTWSSRLRFYDVDKATGRVNANSPKYPLFTERQTLINTDGANIYWANDYTSYGNNTLFGLGSSAKEDEWKSALVPWVIRTGNDNDIANRYGKAQGYSQDYRERKPTQENPDTRNLGDIIDSPVLTIGGGTADGLVNGRNEFLVTAANDGMVHLFRSHDDQNPYSLALSYIPAAMERGSESDNYGGQNIAHTLKEVADKDYGDAAHPHRYLINGGIVVRRTANDANVKGQQSFMFGAMGQGARGAYALNIGGKNRVTGENIGLNAASSSWLSQVPLFETKKTNEDTANGKPYYMNMLGYTVGTPQIGRIALQRENGAVNFEQNTRYGGFLASGYGLERSSSPETALYVYDMLGQSAYDGSINGAVAGDVIHKFEIGGTAGLSSPTLVDTDFDGVVDVAYAGDYAGNMYRFDMRADSTSDWKVTKIFSGNPSQPITSAPAVSRLASNKYVVIFGTGSDIYQEDINDKNQQAVYGVYDDLTVETPTTVSVSDLQQQDLSETGDGFRQITNTKAIAEGKKGWFVPLGANDGERVVVKPTMILRTAVVSTRIYNQKTIKTEGNSADVCRVDSETTETSSSSWILALNAETGGALKKADARLKFIQQADPAAPYYAGMKYDGITSFTYMDATKLNDSPVTRDGDSGGSGTDQPFKAPNSEIPNNKCFSRDAVRVLLTNKNESFDIEGRICGIRRLSWREIFF